VRHDREAALANKTYYGNYFKIAEHIWMNYKNSLTLKTLSQDVAKLSSYFRTSLSPKSFANKPDDKSQQNPYLAQRKFNNYVKNELISLNAKQTNLSWFIDLCSGNGQDMSKYINCGFCNGLFTDVDRDALTEIVNRKYIYIDDNKIRSSDTQKVKDPSQNRNCKIFIKHMDMSQPNRVNAEAIYNSYFGIPTDGVPLVVCNFALHYFIPTLTKMRNFINFLNKILAPGGIFIFTAFNGEKVFDLLKDIDSTKSWKRRENDQLKYSIKKKYTSDKFTGVNQKIDVLLPFSGGKYYTESLINNELFTNELEKKKIRLMAESSFDMYLDKFKKNKPHFYEKLTNGDKKYVSLYSFHVYHKDNRSR
jgi:SAM-dependent methyltransferase